MKRRIVVAILAVIFIFSMAITASADSAASNIQIYCTVDSNGDCRVSMSVIIRLETAVTHLSFPLPRNAEDITKDGDSVSTTKTDNAVMVDISKSVRGMTGDIMMRFEFTLEDAVSANDGKLYLELPLLSGFEYPTETMKFDIMMPADSIVEKPIFTSTYHSEGIESSLTYVIDGNMISGSIARSMKDRETLTMNMMVKREAFPTVSTYQRVGNPEIVPMGICAGAAFLYWLIFLRGLPLIRVRRNFPPEGVTAGELGSRLTLTGADLTMMLFSWAQLGYLLIHLDDNGRVMLHKRMEMGNERSGFEVKTFQRLFGKKRMIDGTGYQYARLCRSVARNVPSKKAMCRRSNGNTKIFRFLACGVHLFLGICLAMNLTGITGLQIVLAIFLSVLAAVSAWLIQAGIYRIHLRYKLPLLISLGLSVLWILIGILSGIWLIALLCVLAQILAGFAAAYGGRRTDLGRQNASQILGLRQYLKKVSGEELQRIQKNDPEYFFNQIPFAMAMGVGKSFAKGFGRKKMPSCPYFICGVHSKMTAEDWYRFMFEAAETLDYRQRRMELEKILASRVR